MVKGIVNCAYDVQGVIEPLDFHTHSQLEIYQLLEGKVYYQIGERFYQLEAGDILLIDGMRIHKAFLPREDQPYHRNLLHFDRSLIEPILESMDLTGLLDMFNSSAGHLFRFQHDEDLQEVLTTFKELASLFRHADSGSNQQLMRLKIVSLLIKIHDFAHDDNDKLQADREDQIKKAEEVTLFIMHHYHEKLTLDDIAQGVNISKSYLSYLFKEVTGTTIMNFLMEFRLIQSRFQLLMNESLMIREIAEKCGFESASHFSRFFKKHTGVSPSEFRALEYQEALNLGTATDASKDPFGIQHTKELKECHKK